MPEQLQELAPPYDYIIPYCIYWKIGFNFQQPASSPQRLFSALMSKQVSVDEAPQSTIATDLSVVTLTGSSAVRDIAARARPSLSRSNPHDPFIHMVPIYPRGSR